MTGVQTCALPIYELLSSQEDSDIAARGFSSEKVSYALDLSESGELLSVTSIKQEKGKKLEPRVIKVPERVNRRRAVLTNFLCDNSSYVLGFDNKGNPERTLECFSAFKELHKLILSNIKGKEATSILNFLEKWNVEEAPNNTLLEPFIEDILKGGNFVFRLDNKMIHKNEEIKEAWLNYISSDDKTEQQQCLVTGKMDNVARLHPVIKGLYNGQSMGNQLVSFNKSAYESYGKKQGQNAPTGEYAAFAYGTALNALLADKEHKMLLGDTTVIYWAESLEAKIATSIAELLQGPKFTEEEKKVDDLSKANEIGAILSKISHGNKINYNDSIFGDKTKIFIAGLSPNTARISVRFYIEDSLGQFAVKMAKHYEAMAIQKRFDNEHASIPIRKIINETVPGNSKDKKPSPLLAGALLRAILTGSPYPESLYRTFLDRIRAEKDVSYTKAAFIKAYLTRKYNRNESNEKELINTETEKIEKNNESIKEVLVMSLNETSNNKAYLLGRLFSVLEKAQVDANRGIKSTISEKYLSSASSTPGKIFPILLNLSTYHTAKSDYGAKSKKDIEEILGKLEVEENPFPKHLTTDEQGIFYLGYYHQNPVNYKSKEDK